MIRGVFFDAAGVLYSRPRPTDDFALDLLAARGFSREIPRDENAGLEALRVRASNGLTSHETYWDTFLALHGVAGAEERQALVERITEYSNRVQPTPGGKETLAGLKRRGLCVGIVTDTMYPVEWKMRRLASVGLSEYIDIVACSTVLGVHKPEPAIYLHAVLEARLAATECAFVGHDSTELRGAKAAGMTTIAVNYDEGAEADYFVGALLGLLDLPVLAGGEVRSIGGQEP